MSEQQPIDPEASRISAILNRELEREANELDAVTRSKLSAARHRATANVPGRHAISKPWALGASLASIALLVLVVLPNLAPLSTPPSDQPQLTAATAVLEDLNILAASDSVEFYQSVDFLLWLENNAGSEG